MASMGNAAESPVCEGNKEDHDIDRMKALHMVWGKIEADSSCSSDSLNRKVSRMDRLQNVSLLSSSGSQSTSDSSQMGTPNASGVIPAAQTEAHSPLVDQQELDDDSGSEGEDEGEEEAPDPALATVGSKLHSMGKCRPCHFFRAGNVCRHGETCLFCHYHSDLRRKRPGKRRRAKLAQKSALAKAKQDVLGSAEAEAAAQPSGAESSQAAARSIISL